MPDKYGQRDEELIGWESQVRAAIRDVVNRSSRKPFYWGGLAGYDQLSDIAAALNDVRGEEAGTVYLRQLAERVNRIVDRYHVNAQDLRDAHTQLRRIAKCLRYPPSSYPESHTPDSSLSSAQVKREMEELLAEFRPDLKRRPAQAALYDVWHRVGALLRYPWTITGQPGDRIFV